MTLQASFQLPGAEAESLSFEVLRVTQEWTKEVSFAWVLKLTDQLLNDRPFEARERSAGLGFRSPHEIELDAFDPRRPKPGSPTRVLPSPATEPSSARSEEGLEGLIESYEGSRAVARVRIGGAAIPVAFPAAVFIAKGLHPGDRFFWHPRPDGNVLPADIEALSVFSPDEKAQLRAIMEEERGQKQRWYEAAGQRQDELNEAHRAIAWICMGLPFEQENIPEHLRPPEFVARQVKLAKAQYPTRISTLDEWWRCPECGPGVAGDEDGCCANCGADLEIERRSPEPTTAGTQRGTT